MARSIGDYIVFLDCDDFIGTQHLENLYSAITENNALIAATGYSDASIMTPFSENETRRTPSRVTLFNRENGVVALLARDSPYGVMAWGKMYHRSLIPQLHFPEGKIHEDVFVTYKAFFAAQTIAYENANDYFYVQDRGDSIMKTRGIKGLAVLEALDEMHVFFEEKAPMLLRYVECRRYEDTVSAYASLVRGNISDPLVDDLYLRIRGSALKAMKEEGLTLSAKAKYALSLLGRPIMNALIMFDAATRKSRRS
jgi:hypothetical protein